LLEVPIRARVWAGDFSILPFEFLNQIRYNICNTNL